MNDFNAVFCAASLLGWLAGCVQQLPPAEIPDARAPRLQAPPLADGTARLVVDVVDGPTRIERVQMIAAEHAQLDASGETQTTYFFTEVPELACEATPCVVDVPEGNVLLRFPVIGTSFTETELVHVSLEPSVYRRALSAYDDDTGAGRVFGILFASIGGAAAITGIPLLTVGLAGESDGLTVAGAVTLGSGALLITLGTLLITGDAPAFRPGSANHFPVSPSP